MDLPVGLHAGESAAPDVGSVRSLAPSLSMTLSLVPPVRRSSRSLCAPARLRENGGHPLIFWPELSAGGNNLPDAVAHVARRKLRRAVQRSWDAPALRR